MAKRVLFVLLLVFGCAAGYAQDWTGVPRGGKIYYTTPYELPDPWAVPPVDSYYLRLIFIDSSRAQGTDSVHHFWKSWRYNAVGFNTTTCVEGNAASWMGRRFVSRPDGEELYFNSFGDTMRINTRAGVGNSWLVGKDSTGKVIRATVTAMDTTRLDNELDSVKIIALQTLQNGVPVSGLYSGETLRLSKRHGWVNMFEMWSFPNRLSRVSDLGVATIPALHTRVNQFDSMAAPPCWEYGPGSEWIYKHDHDGFYGGLRAARHYQYDSVISSFPLGNNKWHVQMKRAWSSIFYTAMMDGPVDSFRSGTGIVNDTVTSSLLVSNILTVRPEIVDTVLGHNTLLESNPVHYAFSFRKGIGNYHVLSMKRKRSSRRIWLFSNGCLRQVPPVSGINFLEYEQILNSKMSWHRGTWTSDVNGPPYLITERSYPYYKFGQCSYGQRFNVLSVDQPLSGNALRLAPNPADRSFTITLAAGTFGTLYLADMTGRVLLLRDVRAGDNLISTANLVPGLYSVTLQSGQQKQSTKLTVIH